MSGINRIADSINVGVAELYFYPEGQEIPIYLGLTKDGVIFKYETNWKELTSDQTGTTPLDDVQIGESATAEVKILDTTKQKIAMIIPPATAIGSSAEPDAVTFGKRPGLRATHHAGKLVIHPISAGNDRSYDVVIYRTANTGSLELAFKLEEEWVIPCKFKAYFDDSRQTGDQLFRIGEDNSSGEVVKTVNLFWITPSNPDVKVGETVSFRANAMYEDGTTEDVTAKCSWVSSNPALVSLTGTTVKNANALGVGSVVIRAEYIGYSCSTSMVVSNV